MENRIYETKTNSIEHLTIVSNKSFDIVKAKLESLLPRIDDGIFTLLRYRESARALKELEALPALSIFGFRDHGALLSIAGLQRRAIQYDIGNPLTASKMSRHQISAAIYAPIRVLLREDANGVVAFEYDRPISCFAQFGDPQVNVIARQLDEDLKAALDAAAS
jgi:uncharacterized protein (DUF302 family)